MKFQLRHAGGLGIFLVLLGWVRANPMPGVDDRWRHFETPNFELYSRQGERESRDLLHGLELLRAVFLERFKLVERQRLEVTVFAFRTVEDFRAYLEEGHRKSDFFKGYYQWRADRAVILVAPMDDGDAARRLISHEYIHHLCRATGFTPPVWYHEGIADLFATIDAVGGELKIGRAHDGWIATLQRARLMPLGALFAVNQGSPIYRTGQHTGLFYAQSWALLHYWYFGQSDIPRARVDQFVTVAGDWARAQNADLAASFREAFGMEYAAMEKRLEDYVRGGAYRVATQPAPAIAPAKTYAQRAVTRDEMQVRLGELALRMHRSPLGKLVLLEAIERNPKDPRPHEALGADFMFEHNEVAARERWEQAIEAGTRNVAIYRELGVMESRGWFQHFDLYFRLPADAAERLRTRLTRAIAYAPSQTAPYELLAWVEAFAPEPAIANVNLVQTQFPQLRERARTLLALACVRQRVNDAATALQLLDALGKMEPDAWTARGAEMLRAKIEGRPARRIPAAGPRPSGGSGSPVKLPPVEIPGLR